MVSQVVETGFPEFTTFSVGESVDRRTVVCFQQQLLDYTLGNIRWEKARDTGEFVTAPGPGLMVQHDSTHRDKLDTNFLTEAVTCQPEAGDLRGCEPPSADPSPAPDLTPTKARPPGSRKSRKRPERQVYVPPVGRGGGRPLSANAMEFKPNSPVGHVLSSSGASDPEAPEVTEARDMTDQVVAEITTALGGVQMESPAVDYTSFQTSDTTINIDQFGHVIELYDFPPEMKTNDLMAAFSAFTSR